MEQPPAESVPPEAARDDEVRCLRFLVTTDDCGLPDLGYHGCALSMVVVVTATTSYTRLLLVITFPVLSCRELQHHQRHQVRHIALRHTF
jgi:hypothetical protein